MRILVVEDDHLLNSTLCYNLSAGGYKVDSANTKAEAEAAAGVSEEEVKGLIAKAMKDFAASLIAE